VSPKDIAAKWYVSSEGQRYGPYPSHILTEWIAIGRIAADALVSDGSEWITVSQFMQQQAKAAVAPRPEELELEVIEDTVASDGPSSHRVGSKASAAEAVAGASVTTMPPDDSPPERDRIVVIGRRQSGKTIYLATLYAKLWKSLNGMTAKAVSGEVHRQLIGVHQTLQAGRWPAATLGTSQIEMDIEHAGRKRLMVTLDFAGELFRKAFVEEQADFPGVKELTEHIDRAASVLLLVDPSVVAGMDHEAAMDDDFGLVQAVQRIRNWPGGESVPIVLVLTKMDQYQHLLDQVGGSKGFVRKYFPALVRLMKHIPIFQVSAVQTDKGNDGTVIPRLDSQSVNIDTPLRFCLDLIDKTQENAEQQRLEEQRIAYERQQEEAERARERRQNRILIVVLTAILIIGAAVVALIIIYKV
jgi:GTPase SAR1 family protein